MSFYVSKMYKLAVIETMVVLIVFNEFSMHNVQDWGLIVLKEFGKTVYSHSKLNYFLKV